jgi:hypothetical protein
MTFDKFKDLIIFLKNSLNPSINLNERTVKTWYDLYFKYYEEERVEKVFKHLARSGQELTLQNIVDSFVEFEGYFLPDEVEKCIKIIKQAKVEGKKIRENFYPILKETYDLPLAEAWELAFKKEG